MPMEYKRLTLFCGHYGSGKTNVAVNTAMKLGSTKENVALADLDIVNPYFRARDSEKLLSDGGVRVICSPFANSNVDFPALPQEMYSLTDDRSITAVLDIGGDERGALALGRIAPAIVSENDYEMLLVINMYRPLTPDVQSVLEIKEEIEGACRIPFTGIVNNSNLGEDTTEDTVLRSVPFAEEVSRAAGIPVTMTSVSEKLMPALTGKIPDLFPMKITKLSDYFERN